MDSLDSSGSPQIGDLERAISLAPATTEPNWG
jgi:hypothetical protein